MERKFLEDLGLEKETVDKILDQNSADIGKHIKTIGALELERDGRHIYGRGQERNYGIDSVRIRNICCHLSGRL